MSRFYGAVGYAISSEVVPGVYDDVITERFYRGDVIRYTRRLDATDKVNDNLSVDNSISIIADAFANEHFFDIKYVLWSGVRWEVPVVSIERPRLILTLGGVYNGPTP